MLSKHFTIYTPGPIFIAFHVVVLVLGGIICIPKLGRNQFDPLSEKMNMKNIFLWDIFLGEKQEIKKLGIKT
jgi:hypothetical protein